MGTSAWENVIERTYMLGEFLSQPGKDLVACVGEAIYDNQMIIFSSSNLPTYYRVTDIGCGMGFSSCNLDAAPEDADDLPLITRDGSGRWCIRARDAFASGRYWPTFQYEAFMATQGEASPRKSPIRATLWCEHAIDPDDEADCWSLYDELDVIVSTGHLQWASEPRQAIRNLMIPLRSRGYLCATMPKLASRESFLNMAFSRVEAYAGPSPDIIATPVSNALQTLSTLSAAECMEVLSTVSEDFRVWETTYYQLLHDAHDLEEWYVQSGWQELLASMAYHGGLGEPVMKEELLKWLRAGNPTPMGSNLLLSYPFISFIARKE